MPLALKNKDSLINRNSSMCRWIIRPSIKVSVVKSIRHSYLCGQYFSCTTYLHVLCSVSAFSSNILTQNFECYVTAPDFISLLCLVV